MDSAGVGETPADLSSASESSAGTSVAPYCGSLPQSIILTRYSRMGTLLSRPIFFLRRLRLFSTDSTSLNVICDISFDVSPMYM